MKASTSSRHQQLIATTVPASEQPLKLVKGDVRQRLMDASLELLKSQGYQALTQARVAETAGVRQSHLTYYFRTRDDLLKAVVEEGCSALLDIITDFSRPGKASLGKFRNALLNAINDKNMSRLLLSLTIASDEDPALKIWLAEFDRSLQARLGASFLQLGLKPTTIDLTLFHATIVGTSILSLQYSDAEWTRTSSKVMRLAFERLVDNSRILPVKNRKTSRL